MVKIDKKIVGYSVVSKDRLDNSEIKSRPEELKTRGDVLTGKTYRIKTPLSDHAFYITINDIILNEGEPNEKRRPFEIFINSKCMENFQWITAQTRMMSAVFRREEDCRFVIDELRSIFDPKGGYFKKGGKYVPSVVSEIGDVIEKHMIDLGLIEVDRSLADAAKNMITEKMKDSPKDKGGIGDVCSKCGESSLIKMDGCMTCTSCGDSKCS